MKKNPKCIFASLMVAVMILALMPQSIAIADAPNGNCEYHYSANGAEFTVSFRDNVLSEKQRIRVAEHILGLDDRAKQYGLRCTLFGHSYGEKSNLTVTEHKVREKAPRCKQYNYTVRVCSVCDYEDVVLENSFYISCCPVD